MFKLEMLKIPKDKVVSMLIGGVLGLLVGFASVPGAICAVAVAAVGKEIYDVLSSDEQRPKADTLDIIFTIAGGAIGILVSQILMSVL